MNGPRSMVWLLTARCNLACEHCYATRFVDRGELDEQQALRVAEDAARSGVKHIGFTGGEVFLREDALALMRYASGAGVSTSVVTNGCAMAAELAGEMAALGVRVLLSIDGATREVHEKVRGKDSWRQAIAAADSLRNAGAWFGTIMAVSRLNRGEVRDYVHLAKELGARVGCLIPVMPTGRATVDLTLSPAEMLTVLRDADSAADESDLPVSFWCTPFASLAVKSSRVSAGFCRTSSEDVDIDPAGNVLLCDILDNVFSNVTETGVFRAWRELEDDALVKAVTYPALRAPCTGCRLRDRCRGGCFARSQLIAGDIHAPDPLCPRVGGVL